MISTNDKLTADIEKVKKIPIVPSMLEVICLTTGMGFAAIARVTQDKWIACSVRDEIQFGLEPGGELTLETTICNEIRENHQAVIIDHVAEDALFRYHHTPQMYGFQSYISVPIMLKNGEFFGTLCAIDPKPALLKNPKTIGMFNLFAELISFHLQSQDLIEQSHSTIETLNRHLTDTVEENRQYQYISNHNLQEPLRKIRMFGNMLVDAAEMNDTDRTKEIAAKINSSAQHFTMMIKDLSDFSELNDADAAFEATDLNAIVEDVCSQLRPQMEVKDIQLHVGGLPSIPAIPQQIEQVFYQLIYNAIKFARNDVQRVIKISSKELENAYEIRFEDNGIGIHPSQLETIFDIFSGNQAGGKLGVGLAYCRKIVRNHKGSISATSESGRGTTFSVIFPAKRV